MKIVNGISGDKSSRAVAWFFILGKYFYAFILQGLSLFTTFLVKRRLDKKKILTQYVEYE